MKTIVLRNTVRGAALGFTLLLATGARADLAISSGATQNVSCAAGVCTATAKKAVLNVNDLTAMLAAGDATVKSGSLAQDIDIKAAINWTSASRLTLDSYHSISFEKPVIVSGSSGALTITTNDGGFGGNFIFVGNGHVEYPDVTADLSRLVINGIQYQLAKSSKGISRKFRFHGYDHYVALAKSYNAAKEGVHSSPIIGELDGVFEGLGNAISNLSIDNTSAGLVGFVGKTDERSAVIRDLNLVNASVTAGERAGSVGALVGSVLAESGQYNVFRCSATGQVTAGGNYNAGGLVGSSEGRILQSQANVDIVAGNDSEAGGLVGHNSLGYVDQSYAAGSVVGGDNSSVGGLVGGEENPITNSYAQGPATGGGNSNVGGLVGSISEVSGISTSYSIGYVTGGTGTTLGGFIGLDDGPPGKFFANYWDLDTSGIDDPAQGIGNIPNAPGVTGLTDAQLKSALPDGFDPKVWGQNPNINNGYPYLLANPPPKNAPGKRSPKFRAR